MGKIRAALLALCMPAFTACAANVAAVAPKPTGFVPHTATMLGSGDVLIHPPLTEQAQQDGADIVVLSLHWGTEYDHLATPTQFTQAKALLASPDVAPILGDHAHVIEPMPKLGDKWVIYCMGNLVARHSDPIDDNREGVLAKFTFTEVHPHVFSVSKAEAIPVWMQIEPKLRLIELPRALADPGTTPEQLAVYRNAWNRIAGYLDAYGAVKNGLVIDR